MNLNIVFENGLFLIIDKPAGLVVNRSETIYEETLQDQLSNYFNLKQGDLGIGGRSGIVHRLDRETSGLLIVAKTQKSFDFLQTQFRERTIDKEYLALVHGKIFHNKGSIGIKIGRIGKFGKFGVLEKRQDWGRETITNYQVLRRYRFKERQFLTFISSFTKSRIIYLKSHSRLYTYVSISPKTGRTHQIRVALKHLGHPIVSDSIYAPSKLIKFDFLWCSRLFLHASKIEFNDPRTFKRLKFESLLPKDLENSIGRLTIDN